jgi:Domain of unknown function (DUF5625)
MPAGYVYPAVVVLIVLTTVMPAFIIARVVPSFGFLIGYFAGLGCGVLTLVAEAYLTNKTKWDDVFFVLLLPVVGIAVALIWPSKSVQQIRSTRRFLAIALLILAAAFVYDVVSEQSERVEVPFEAGTKGSVVEVQFRVPKKGYAYSFFLDLQYKEGDRQDRDRVQQLAVTGGYDSNQRPINTGLAIPVRLIVERIGNDGSKPILDSVFTDHELAGSGSGSYSKRIISVRLEAGRYRARIEALENIRQLEGVPVHFAVGIPGSE